MSRQRPICQRCKVREVEHDDEMDWESDCCPECNDIRIQQASERREWDHFHPTTK